MKLVEYLPQFLKEIREFKEIFRVEDIEINNLKNEIEKLLQEVIVITAESYGLERYEKIYLIDTETPNIDERRFNIISKMNNKVPFTYNWLIKKLNNTIGEGNYIVNVNCNEYKIHIEILAIYKNIAELLYKDLREQLSANLEIIINLFQTEECCNYFAGVVHTGDFIEIRQVI